MFKKKVSFGLTLMLIVFVLVGCGGGGDIPPTTTSITSSSTTSSTTTTSTTTIPSSTTSSTTTTSTTTTSTTTTSTTTTTISGYTVSGKFYLNDVLNSSDNETQITIKGLTGSLTKIATVSAGNFSFSAVPNGVYHIFFGTNAIPIASNYLFITAEVSGANVNNAHVYLYNVFTTVEASGGGLGGVTLESYIAVNTGAGWLNSSEASGLLSFVGLKNRSYTLRPIKTGYTFSPTTRDTGVLSAQKYIAGFAATGAYSISGKACFHSTEVSSGVKSPTVKLFSGGSLVSEETPVNGEYSFSGLGSGTYRVWANKTGWDFTSREVTITNASQTGQNIAGNPTSWEVLRVGVSDEILRGFISVEGTYYAGGAKGGSPYFLRSNDLGQSWEVVTVTPEADKIVWISDSDEGGGVIALDRLSALWAFDGTNWAPYGGGELMHITNEAVSDFLAEGEGEMLPPYWLVLKEDGAVMQSIDTMATWTGLNYISGARGFCQGDAEEIFVFGTGGLYQSAPSIEVVLGEGDWENEPSPAVKNFTAMGFHMDNGQDHRVLAADDGSIYKAVNPGAPGDWGALQGIPYVVRRIDSRSTGPNFQGVTAVGANGLIMRHR